MRGVGIRRVWARDGLPTDLRERGEIDHTVGARKEAGLGGALLSDEEGGARAVRRAAAQAGRQTALSTNLCMRRERLASAVNEEGRG